MSRFSSVPPPSAKTELETVVNWPLLVSAAALALLALAVPLVLACIAAWKGDAAPDKVASRPAMPEPQPRKEAPPARAVQPASRAKPEEIATPLQVYVEGNRPAHLPVPAPAVAVAPRPRTLDPILQVPDVQEQTGFKHFDSLPEDALLSDLRRTIREVDLESVRGTREKVLTQARDAAKADRKSSSILALSAQRPDLKGLPLIGEDACQVRPEAAKKRQVISRRLRRVLAPPRRGGDYRGLEYRTLLGDNRDWLDKDGLSTVVQMMQTGDHDMRSDLVERLATVRRAEATTSLARAALFDLAPQVRQQAVLALKERPRSEYEQPLLDGFRYPWPPVAAHAAEALVALKDREALPRLAALLEETDPCAPYRNGANKWVVSEVVAVNHLRNCLLCHAPSTAPTDPLRGVVPTPGQPLPVVYYASRTGDFVRADVTYLRQDFSVMHRVAKPDKWPQWQRFDYLVRTRELTAEELAAHKETTRHAATSSYPQREAVLFALRELTGQRGGERSSDWYDLLYTLEMSAEE